MPYGFLVASLCAGGFLRTTFSQWLNSVIDDRYPPPSLMVDVARPLLPGTPTGRGVPAQLYHYEPIRRMNALHPLRFMTEQRVLNACTSGLVRVDGPFDARRATLGRGDGRGYRYDAACHAWTFWDSRTLLAVKNNTACPSCPTHALFPPCLCPVYQFWTLRNIYWRCVPGANQCWP